MDAFQQRVAVATEVVCDSLVDCDGEVLDVCLQKEKGREKSSGFGSERARVKSESWAFALPENLTANREFPTKGSQIVSGAAVSCKCEFDRFAGGQKFVESLFVQGAFEAF